MQEDALKHEHETITRCPHCNTSFRVSAAHLNTAKGAVRCGSCLGIFNALQHVITDTEHSPEIDSEPATTSDDIQNELHQEHHERQSTQSTLQKINDKAKLTNISSSSQPNTTIDPKPEPEPDHTQEKNITLDDDESESDIMFNIDDLENDIQTQQSNPLPESSLFEFSFERDEEPVTSDEDETWALDLLNSDDPDKHADKDEKEEEGEDEAHAHETLFESQDIEHAEGEQEALDFSGIDNSAGLEQGEDEYYRQFDINDEDEEVDDSAYDQGAFGAHPSTRYVESIEPEPVEFTWKSGPRFWQSNIFWGSLVALMVFVLILQLAVTNFDKLSRKEPFRQYYGLICNWFVCELPSLVNRKAVVATNLIIRAHPDQSGVLMVDALLQNKAEYSQPFPPLDLVFTDISGQAITAKRIEPHEYLGGELSGAKTMPSRQPVRISLALRDPGSEAKGYKLDIAP